MTLARQLATVGVVALMMANAEADTAVPLPITGGFNKAVIADGASAPASTTVTMDGFSTLYDTSWALDNQVGNSIAVSKAFLAGKTVTGASSGVKYTLPKASANGTVPDTLLLFANSNASGTLTFAPVTGVTALYVLGTSTNGPSILNCTLHFSDGTKVRGTVTFSDWAAPAAGDVKDMTGLGNVSVKSNSYNGNANNLSLYTQTIKVPHIDQNLDLDSIIFSYSNGAGGNTSVAIFAVSADGAEDAATTLH